KVAVGVDPAANCHGLSHVSRTQFAAGMSPKHRIILESKRSAENKPAAQHQTSAERPGFETAIIEARPIAGKPIPPGWRTSVFPMVTRNVSEDVAACRIPMQQSAN